MYSAAAVMLQCLTVHGLHDLVMVTFPVACSLPCALQIHCMDSAVYRKCMRSVLAFLEVEPPINDKVNTVYAQCTLHSAVFLQCTHSLYCRYTQYCMLWSVSIKDITVRDSKGLYVPGFM